MKRFKNIVGIALASALLLPAFMQNASAQTDADLLNFSMLNPLGTCRYNAMGGAFGALGANASVLSTNPAGIGLYTRHEFSLTLGLGTSENRSTYYGNREYADDTKFNLPQASAILSFDVKGEEGTRIQVGFAANRVKDFSTYRYTKGINTQSSYADFLAACGAGQDLTRGGNNLGSLAWDLGIIDRYDEENNLYRASFGTDGSLLNPGLEQTHILQERGNITECAFSFSGSWQDKLYYGVSLGVPVLEYRQNTDVFEYTADNKTIEAHPNSTSTVLFKGYSVGQKLRMDGTGINLKLGIIYRPVDFFRFGVAIHTPTYFWLKEKSTVEVGTDMTYSYLQDGTTHILDNFSSFSYSTDYDIATPSKAIFSLGFLIKNFGAVGVEGELIDYRDMKLKRSDNIEYRNQLRNTIRENYGMAGVIRVGTEWKVSIVSFRAGYIWQSCPYKNSDLRRQWSDHTVTAGIGLNLGRCWNLDFAVMANMGKRTNDFYNMVDASGAALVQPAQVNFSKYLYTLTLGFRF